ncbi:MAG: hypothetical protein BroJett021_21170 [Chloroflexota bacterium]|jgi:hypothetical protein|nr:MAG: hypothetical protein BroJett021_21170 [Chloroflexota bacterium]
MAELFSNMNIAPTVSRRLLAIVLFCAVITIGSVYAYLWWLAPTPTAVETANELLTFSLSDYATLDGVFCKAPVTGVTRVLSPSEFEKEFGVRIRLLGVTAGGGLIDFRYRVVDLAKALPLLGTHETMPVLVDKASKAELRAPETMMHHDALKQDRTYFMHYPNAGNSIRPGAQVAIVMGDIRVEWVTAQ